MLLRRVDKRRLLRRSWPAITSRIHDADRLAQFAENRPAKAEEPESALPQQQPMLPPDHHASPGHEDPVPRVSEFDQNPQPVAPQNGQPLALEPHMLDLILQNLIAQPLNHG